MPEVLVCGHVCLDIIPELPANVEFMPGRLVEAGPVTLCTGGAVANTGVALTRLGVQVCAVGKIGDDTFGRSIREILDSERAGLGESMAVAHGESTSYTIVLNSPGRDRTFLHDPGCNATFGQADVSDRELAAARVMHFGYPTLMARMYRDDGAELVRLFQRAKSAGLVTSLDMTLPDRNAEAGRVNWRSILGRALPYVDVFLPSVEELAYMLEGLVLDSIPPAGDPLYERLAAATVEMGAKFAGVKAGAEGFAVSVAPDAPPLVVKQKWAPGMYWVPAFDVEVRGTTGAGDATIAGFLMGLVRGFSPEDTLNAAAAAGACCCERADAASGIRPWPELQMRITGGWTRRQTDLRGWAPFGAGIFFKP